MKTTKTEFRYFNVLQYDEEAEYLQEMHKKGWKFIGVNLPGFYHFMKCEPENIIYQLDYNQDGIEHKDEYVQMFNDCGWEYLFDFVGYSYFRKPASELNENESIFCDDNSRLEMVKRIFKGRMIPLLIIFSLCIIPQLLLQFLNRGISPLFIFFLAMFAFYMAIFISYGISYYKYKKRVR